MKRPVVALERAFQQAPAVDAGQRLSAEERLRLLEVHAERLHRYIRRFLRGADAEDLLQDLRVLVLRHPAGPAGEQQFIAWCKGLVRNLVAHHFRRQRRRDRLHAAVKLVGDPRTTQDPEQAAALQEQFGQIWSDISIEEKALIFERFVLESTHDEIAARQRRSAASVRMRLARLRASLRGGARQSADPAPTGAPDSDRSKRP